MLRTLSHDTEQCLIAAMQKGDKEAFEELYDRYAPLLLGIISRIVGDGKPAEDTLQNTFLQIWTLRHTYDSKERLFIWMINITKQVAATANIPAPVTYIPATEHHPEQLQKAVMEMAYFNKCKVSEITERLNITEDTLRTTLKSALKNLKNGSAA